MPVTDANRHLIVQRMEIDEEMREVTERLNDAIFDEDTDAIEAECRKYVELADTRNAVVWEIRRVNQVVASAQTEGAI